MQRSRSSALAAYREVGNRAGEAVALDTLGYVHHAMAQHAEAIARYQQALDVHGDADRGVRAEILTHLGDARQAVGDLGAAWQAWQQALAILDDLNDPAAASGVRAKLSESRAATAVS